MTTPPLVEVLHEVPPFDERYRREALACGHVKTTIIRSDRPAKRRYCYDCWTASQSDPT